MTVRGVLTYLGISLLGMSLCATTAEAANIFVSSQSGAYVEGLDFAGNQQFQTSISGQPIGITVDATGNAYVSVFAPGTQANTIQKISASGSVLGTFATLPGTVNGPFDAAFDASGNLYVSALGSDVIEKFNSSGAFVGTLANIAAPRGLVFDSSGNLWVVSSAAGGALYRITNTSTLNQTPTAVSTSGLNDPRYAAFDASGNLYVDNTNTGGSTGNIVRFSVSGGTLSAPSTFASGLGGPNGLAFGPSGALFVADYFDNNIHEFSSTAADLGVFKSGILTANGLAISGVPEPATLALMGIGLLAVGLRRRSISN